MTTLNTFIPEIRNQIYSFLDNKSLVRLCLVSKIFSNELTNDPFFKDKFLKDNPIFKTIHERFFKELLSFHPKFFWKAASLSSTQSLSSSFFRSAFPQIKEKFTQQQAEIKKEKELKNAKLIEAKETYKQSQKEFNSLAEEYGFPEEVFDENGPNFKDQLEGLLEQGKNQGISEEDIYAGIDRRLIPLAQAKKLEAAYSLYSDLAKADEEQTTENTVLTNALYLFETDPQILESEYKYYFYNSFKKGEDYLQNLNDNISRLNKVKTITLKNENDFSEEGMTQITTIIESCTNHAQRVFFELFAEEDLISEVPSPKQFLEIISKVIKELESEVNPQIENDSFLGALIEKAAEDHAAKDMEIQATLDLLNSSQIEEDI